MTYDLAKQLKDAGFPQGGLGRFQCGYYKDHHILDCGCAKDMHVYFPTLSELIERCGEKFVYLIKGKEPIPEVTYLGISDFFEWHAIAQFSENGGFHDIRGHGHTPKEATAKLCLALHIAEHEPENDKAPA